MSMRKNDGADVARFDRKWFPILWPKRLETLKQPAINENLMSLAFNEVFGPGNCTNATQEREIEGH